MNARRFDPRIRSPHFSCQRRLVSWIAPVDPDAAPEPPCQPPMTKSPGIEARHMTVPIFLPFPVWTDLRNSYLKPPDLL
jgi:hypothetical protein